MGCRIASGLVAALPLALACATKPPSQQGWVEVQTPHFRILSSLSRSATARLARDLELFRRGVELLAGEGLPAAARSLVLAFDDRRPMGSFASGPRSSYLLSSPDGVRVVLREAGGWRGDAGTGLRHDLAHALLRGRDGLDMPLWYEEGIAQVASTIDVGDRVARIGGVRADLLGQLRSGPRIPPETLLELRSFDAPAQPRRRRFEAESFAFVHSLCFGTHAPRHAPARLLELASAGPTDGVRIERTLGLPPDELERELRDYPSRAQDGSLELRAGGETPPPPRSRPLARSEVLIELGELALALGRRELARSQFEAGLASASQAARVRAGLAAVEALDGDWTRAASRVEEALSSGPRDARVEHRAGDLWLARARLATGEQERSRYTERARLHYRRSLDRDPRQAGPHAGIAASRLVEGRELDAGFAALERAERLNPGSLELRVLRVRLLRAAGESEAAGELASRLRARLHRGVELRRPTILSIEAGPDGDAVTALR